MAYLDPTIGGPNAASGADLLKQSGLLLRPVINTRGGGFEQHAGGSNQQPLPYLDPTLPSPSALAGPNLLQQQGLIVRPVIERQSGGSGSHGGFIPSVMKGVVNSAFIVGPLAAIAAKKMIYNTRKNRHGGGSLLTTGRGGGKKENWAQNREAAKEELTQYGKPSALNVNKYAALKRKSDDEAEDWLVGYILKKRKTVKKSKKAPKNKTEKVAKVTKKKAKKEHNGVKTVSLWKDLVERAKKDLGKYGKPSGANTAKLASLHKKGLNTKQFFENYQTRKKYVTPTVKSARNTYKNNLQEARQYLSQYGKPTVANTAKFVSLKRKGESVKGIENAVKSRVKPVTLQATAVKATSRSPPVATATARVTVNSTLEKMKRNLAILHKKIQTYEQGKR